MLGIVGGFICLRGVCGLRYGHAMKMGGVKYWDTIALFAVGLHSLSTKMVQ